MWIRVGSSRSTDNFTRAGSGCQLKKPWTFLAGPVDAFRRFGVGRIGVGFYEDGRRSIETIQFLRKNNVLGQVVS
jgi:hypothetical protein